VTVKEKKVEIESAEEAKTTISVKNIIAAFQIKRKNKQNQAFNFT
jgi:hypothetical protein